MIPFLQKNNKMMNIYTYVCGSKKFDKDKEDRTADW